MPKPSRPMNEERKFRLIRTLAPVMHTIDRDLIRRAPYAVRPHIPTAQQNTLNDHAVELGAPPGPVIARNIATAEGHTVEILSGWERLQAFIRQETGPKAPTLPLGIIDCNAPDAAFYAIEYASQDQKAAGWVTSPLLYASAAQAAIEHFGKPDDPWSIQTLGNALCIARPTLSNRLRLLKGLQPRTRQLLQQGLVKPEFAKILLAEPSPKRQEHLATRVARGMMSTRVLYKLVHPHYKPPITITEDTNQNNNQVTGDITMNFNNLSELKALLEELDKNPATNTPLRGSLTIKVNNKNDANDPLLTQYPGAAEAQTPPHGE